MKRDDFITLPAVYGRGDEDETAEDLIAKNEAKYTNYRVRKDTIIVYTESEMKGCCEVGLITGESFFVLLSVEELEQQLFGVNNDRN